MSPFESLNYQGSCVWITFFFQRMKRNANNHANNLKKRLEQNYPSYVLTCSLGELD
jgi:hypothetical protein